MEFDISPSFGIGSSPPSPTDPPKCKTWTELRKAVKENRRLQTSLANRLPHTFVFRTINSDLGKRTRLYFLGILPGGRENTLLYVDIPSETTSLDENNENESHWLIWKPLLEPFQVTPSMGQFSKEEQLLRERKRLGAFGITSFDLDLESGKFVFPASNSLYYCVDQEFTQQVLFPFELKTSCIGARLDPKICPNNSELITFICCNDIWLYHSSLEWERRFTFAHKGNTSLETDSHSAGVPSFVMQEEFDRYTSHWWQPQTDLEFENCDSHVYRILYEEVDESEVDIIHIVSPNSEDRQSDEYRYPKAGSQNAKSYLKMLEFQLDEHGQIKGDIVELQIAESLSSLFPWAEYLVRIGWTPDGKFVWCQLLSRRQQHLAIILIPLNCFVPYIVHNETEFNHSDVNPSCVQVIYEEISEIWINVHDILYFFPQEREDEISFIWASEETGFRHLYFVTSCIGTLNLDYAIDPYDRHQLCHIPRLKQKVSLTSGEWEVYGKQLWVDERRRLIYFTATKDTPLECHLYVVSLDAPNMITRLTESGHYHHIALSKDCSLFVSVYSNIRSAPRSYVFRIQHNLQDQPLGVSVETCLLEPSALRCDYQPPELFSFTSKSGYDMYGMLYRPADMELGKKYPTVLFVYGGPQVQLVTNSYKGIRFLRLHMLTSLGFVVVVLDGRGSSHRGLMYEGYIKDRMGTVEIADQVEGLQWIAANTDCIDLSRVAIHGWSYGGYLSLLGLAQRPDVFTLAIAGAPVTTWKAYDTGYTERYIDLPENNSPGYKHGSVLEYVNQFPNEENRLLIVHGLIDENVHFYHTSLLIQALIKACKPYQLQVYPNERHGIRQPDVSEHYETMVLSFLLQHL